MRRTTILLALILASGCRAKTEPPKPTSPLPPVPQTEAEKFLAWCIRESAAYRNAPWENSIAKDNARDEFFSKFKAKVGERFESDMGMLKIEGGLSTLKVFDTNSKLFLSVVSSSWDGFPVNQSDPRTAKLVMGSPIKISGRYKSLTILDDPPHVVGFCLTLDAESAEPR